MATKKKKPVRSSGASRARNSKRGNGMAAKRPTTLKMPRPRRSAPPPNHQDAPTPGSLPPEGPLPSTSPHAGDLLPSIAPSNPSDMDRDDRLLKNLRTHRDHWRAGQHRQEYSPAVDDEASRQSSDEDDVAIQELTRQLLPDDE